VISSDAYNWNRPRADNRVRITLKLVDAILDEHIWSETFEKEVRDVMLLQSEIAQAIAQQVEVTIRPLEQAQLKSAERVNPAMYEAFLKGQFHIERFTPQDMMLAAQNYQQAAKLDPLNPFVQAMHGVQLYMTGDHQGGAGVIEDVIASTPGFGFGFGVLWDFYHRQGEKDKAIAATVNTIRSQDQQTGALALEEAYAGGDYSGAMLYAAEVLAERSETVYVAPLIISSLYDSAGEFEKAIDWMEVAYQIGGPGVPYLGTWPCLQFNQTHVSSNC